MNEIKLFHVSGEVRKPSVNIPFEKRVKALREEDVVEQILSEIGSRHKAKRFQIKILEVTLVEDESS